jgi:uncharacterized protein (TIGR00730 family)
VSETPAPLELDRRVFRREPTPASDVALIAAEFHAGFEAVDAIDRPAVTVFGSARVLEASPFYRAAREVGRCFAKAGFAVVTGGGPGVMEAANRGAREGGGNSYCDVSLTFKHFYARKTMFVKAAEGFVVFPGGFGTMDELFESLTLIQTGKIDNFPLVLFDSDYWGEMLDWATEELLGNGTIGPEDLALMTVTDDPDEAVDLVVKAYERRAGVEA